MQIDVYNASFEFLEKYHGNYDVIFLDIEMPGSDGLEVTREIRQKDEAVGIIFVTGMAQYAVEGYAVHAIDFIVKPVGYYNFSVKLEKAMQFFRKRHSRDILINGKDGIHRISARTVHYIEKEKDDLIFHTIQGQLQMRGSVKMMKEKLEGMPFAECTSGCLVNLEFVNYIGKENLTLMDGTILPLSRRLKKQFTQAYIDYAVFTAVGIYFLYEIDWMETIFIVVSGYASEHMCFAVSRIVLYLSELPYTVVPEHQIHAYITRYVIFVFMAVLEYFVIVKGNKKRNEFSKGDFRIAFLAAILLMTAVALSVYWSYDNSLESTKVGGILCPAYSFICSMLVLIVAYKLLWENEMKQERETMEEMLRMADIQQKSSQEAIDIINIKCHDLKHQIRALSKVEDEETREGYLQEIAGAISIYDATYNTGCRPLDYVLREKALLFNEYQIEFSCMAEGQCITFMTPADIYALFGNALDNALECVQEEKEGERFISMHLTRRGAMILFHLENRCSRTVEFQDGIPITHKEDRNQHGFGVRSIIYIAEKYEGQVFMKAESGKYLLDVMLP